MIASLLVHNASAAVHFIWTVVNFVMLTQYISHNKNTLQYLKHALFQINKLKNVFQHLCSVNSDISEEHFNIFKLHVMIHYAQHIHQYDSADNIDTEYSEIVYKF
jgi:glutaredoxin 2